MASMAMVSPELLTDQMPPDILLASDDPQDMQINPIETPPTPPHVDTTTATTDPRQSMCVGATETPAATGVAESAESAVAGCSSEGSVVGEGVGEVDDGGLTKVSSECAAASTASDGTSSRKGSPSGMVWREWLYLLLLYFWCEY